MINQPYISIVITTHNRKKLLINEIKCLNKQTYNNFEIIIVDDNSTEAIQLNDLNFTKKNKIKLIKNKKKYNMAISRNIGIKNISDKSEYVLVLDDDNEFDKNFLEKIIHIILNNNQIDILQPRAIYSNKKDVMFYGFKYHYSSMIVNNLGRDKKKYPELFKIDSVGNCFLIKKKVISEIGVFDEKYIIDLSETEYCLRAKKSKFNIYSCNIEIYHQTLPEKNSHILRNRIEKRPETYFYTFRNKFLVVKDLLGLKEKILFITFFQFLTLLAYLFYSIKLKSKKLFVNYFLGFLAGNLYFFLSKESKYENFKKISDHFNRIPSGD